MHILDIVVLPTSRPEVSEAASGGGSNKTGMLIPLPGGTLVDTIRMSRIIEVSIPGPYVADQPGITPNELGERLTKHALALSQELSSKRSRERPVRFFSPRSCPFLLSRLKA